LRRELYGALVMVIQSGVREEKWIPRPTTFSAQTYSHLVGEDIVVADLIEDNPVQWNRPFIFQNFGEEESTAICNIPLSRFHHDDKIIWRATKMGEFSVRSAYHLEKERTERLKGECSKGAKPEAMWKMIWSLQIPNSAKMFIWRACNKILPTKDNLRRRKIIEEDSCFLCCRAIETTHHILWDCPSSQDVWSPSGRKLQKIHSGGENFCELIETLMERLMKNELELFVMIVKGIWKRRNGVMHGEQFKHPGEVVRQATGHLNDFRNANMKQGEGMESSPSTKAKWEAPVLDFYKANWDVAISQAENIVGIGVIIRDGQGNVIAALSQQVKSMHDPVTTEAIAARRAVEFCIEVGVQEVIFEGDSMLVVKAIQDSQPNWFPYGQIIDDIKWVMGSLRRWKIRHVKRDANKAAHELSRFATRNSDPYVWLEEPPNCILNTVILEQKALFL
jgi:ribonuclease HI